MALDATVRARIDSDLKKALRDYGEVEEEHVEDHDLEEEWDDHYL